MGLSARGVVFLVAITVVAVPILCHLVAPCFALVALGVSSMKGFLRHVVNFAQFFWMASVACLLEKWYGIEMRFYCDPETKQFEPTMASGEAAFWICNHRTRIDWMLLWSLALRARVLHNLRIVLKAPLRVVPIFGWGTQYFLFIFLNRDWAKDQQYLTKMFSFFAKHEPRTSVLVFPEGTDLSESNVVKSNAFAEKQGLPSRKYSLYPRITGWNFMFPRVRENLDAVYDITMFYVDHAPDERPSEASLVNGRTPRAVYFYVQRMDSTKLPQEEDKLGQWINGRFALKEAHLTAFYEHNGKLPAHAVPLFAEKSISSFYLVALLTLVTSLVAIFIKYATVWHLLYLTTVFATHAWCTSMSRGIDGWLLTLLGEERK